jgi:hypothetical protein
MATLLLFGRRLGAPDLFCRFGKPEQLTIFGIDDAFIDKEISVEGPAPELFTDQYDWNGLDLARLDERQCFEELVERAEAALGEAGTPDTRLRPLLFAA